MSARKAENGFVDRRIVSSRRRRRNNRGRNASDFNDRKIVRQVLALWNESVVSGFGAAFFSLAPLFAGRGAAAVLQRLIVL
jgi:hypothetical protein